MVTIKNIINFTAIVAKYTAFLLMVNIGTIAILVSAMIK